MRWDLHFYCLYNKWKLLPSDWGQTDTEVFIKNAKTNNKGTVLCLSVLWLSQRKEKLDEIIS